jgi:hypothetical protein
MATKKKDFVCKLRPETNLVESTPEALPVPEAAQGQTPERGPEGAAGTTLIIDAIHTFSCNYICH